MANFWPFNIKIWPFFTYNFQTQIWLLTWIWLFPGNQSYCVLLLKVLVILWLLQTFLWKHWCCLCSICEIWKSIFLHNLIHRTLFNIINFTLQLDLRKLASKEFERAQARSQEQLAEASEALASSRLQAERLTGERDAALSEASVLQLETIEYRKKMRQFENVIDSLKTQVGWKDGWIVG